MKLALLRLTAGLLLAAVFPGVHRSAMAAELKAIAGHPVVLDGEGKLLPWETPADRAYHQFLVRRWEFIQTRVPAAPGPAPRSDYPQYFFYDGFVTTAREITPDSWMNDVGEKVPNWFESARLYYAYTGDAQVMVLARGLVDYALAHGTSPATFAWPNFPQTTTGAGDLEFRGFTNRFALHETQVDHAGDMGLTYYRLYQFTGEPRYLTNALHVAVVLAREARVGTATHSVWPYRVRLDTGEITAEYGANWIGCYTLLDQLVRAGVGDTNAFARARDRARDFLLRFPMQTGCWTDGHTDTRVNSHTYKSNLSKSNAALYLCDHPEFDPEWRTHLPALIRWTETNFVFRTNGREPATAFGANVVGEQDDFNVKMDYQTARYAAECAGWFRASGDPDYLEKARRSLNWVTYCSDATGRATESPYSPDVATWWSDCYGECPRMFYPAFAAVPEWAPPGEDHILYSEGVLTRVAYQPGLVAYHAVEPAGTEYLRLRFRPATVTLEGSPLEPATGESSAGWRVRELGGGDYAVTVRRTRAGAVCLRATPEVAVAPDAVPSRLVIDGAKVFQPIDGFGVNLNHRSWAGAELQPVLDAFIGDAGMTVFRVVFDNTDWEEPNDNGDPRVADEAYYQARYGSPRFQPLWDLMAELNRRGLSRHAFFNFMGPGPAWMGGGTLGPGMEAEWAEMIASLLAYARHTRGLRFGLVAPNNEPDIQNEGIHMDAAVYARCLHELAAALERNGLGDVQWIAPDRAGGGTAYLPELLADPVIVAKLAHVGIHSYAAGGGSGGVREFLRSSVCPDRTFWMTEFNVWCPTCDSGTRGNYDWATSRGTAEYLLRHLANGASGGVVWEGVDSLYTHPPAAWSFWGLFAVDDERAATKTYTARKSFHAVAQISRSVRPGARRIDVTGEAGPLAPVLAFRDAGRGDVTVVGINPSAAPVELRGRLASLPGVAELTLGFTTATANAAAGGTCAVRDGAFALRIPPDCVFTLTSAAGAVPP